VQIVQLARVLAVRLGAVAVSLLSPQRRPGGVVARACWLASVLHLV
jgi:hypothetical protein